MSSVEGGMNKGTAAVIEDEHDEPAFIVGIGASAGGLEALERFFQAVPMDTDMAFVVIQHLSPDFKSLMDELLARFTKLPIVRVDGSIVAKPNTIYLLPPRKEMIVRGGNLISVDKATDQPLNMPINTFFRSLARELGPRGVAIVLSGTGSDGTLGLHDVQDAGGLVLAQSAETAKFDGMPRSAIGTGQVDAVMAPEEMPAALVAFAKNPSAPLMTSMQPALAPLVGVPAVIDKMREVYGLDFNYYKAATISRRIDRRVVFRHANSVQDYCARVLEDSEELDGLYKYLLIGVTRFFRDAEAFANLEKTVIPEIIDQLSTGEEARIWVPGCATGEEAYSIAILFIEAFEARRREPMFKLFASDLHRDSLQLAADGLYEDASLAEVAEERRERFFEREAGGYRVIATLRRHIVFSNHNVIRDPPFTRIDLVSCRNLLIYLQAAAQMKALSSFHFALDVGGYLMLGPSEGVNELQNEFETIERQWKIYRKIRDVRLPIEMRGDLLPLSSRSTIRPATPGEVRMSRVYDAILKRYVPTAVLVDSRREVIHVFGDAERFLRVPAGRMSAELVSMMRGDLRVAVSSAIQNALKKGDRVAFRGVRWTEDDIHSTLDIVADPILDPATNNSFVLVLFQEPQYEQTTATPKTAVAELQIADEARARIQQLEAELQHTKDSLHTTVEELETSNEELQASNEELLAANEELQSTNEELHSVNEELYSVNAEHEQKIKELNRVSSDLKNLIPATEIGTIFLDREQRVRFFTPAATKLLNLMAQDIDRDIRHITSRVKDDDVFEDIERVTRTMKPSERRVTSVDGGIYLRRVMPYFDVGKAPSGLVLTFVDITAISVAEERVQTLNVELEKRVTELRASEERFRLIFEGSPYAIIGSDELGIIRIANSQAGAMFSCSAGELLGSPIETFVPEESRELHRIRREVYFRKPVTRTMSRLSKLMGRRKDGTAFAVEIALSPINFGDRTFVLAFIKDQTSTYKLEVERDEILRKMTETQKLESLGLLAGNIAHDFNNLLTGIMAHASLLLDNPHLNHEQHESVDYVLESSRRAAELCQQLLVYSGRGKFLLRPYDISKLVEETSKLVRASSVNKRVEVQFDLASGLPWVLMDVTQIRQVIMNLVINASEAVSAQSGQVTIRTGKTWMTTELLQSVLLADSLEGTECVFIEVSDNGVGIRQEELKRIFEPFYTTKFTGRGLGLSAVLGIVRGHRGALTVTSEPGKGTKFVVFLPPVSDGVSRPDQVSSKPMDWHDTGVVLVADDEAPIRIATRRLLLRMGYEVDLAGSGEEAVELLRQDPNRYALVVLDLTMPGMTGAQALVEIRRIQPTIRVILMSGFSEDDASAVLIGSTSPNWFLAKPFDLDALTAMVKQVMAEKSVAAVT
jgi:two-component system, chemotaxis family, CheB/CheR fusion protein